MGLSDEILQVCYEEKRDILKLLQKYGKEEVLRQMDEQIKAIENDPNISQAWKDFCIKVHRDSTTFAIKEYEHK